MEIKNKLIIQRNRWGVGNKGGWLYNPKMGLSCCLGFRLRQIGFSNSKLQNIQSPEDLLCEFNIKDTSGLEGLVKKRNRRNTEVCGELMEVNDARELSCGEREDKIFELFKKIGTEVKFVGKYKK